MRKYFIISACVVALAGATCTPQEQQLVGGLVGAGFGLAVAEITDANGPWTVIAVLAGAAAGTMVARNNATGECAYARGDGTYYKGVC